jgi:hypothetical protein
MKQTKLNKQLQWIRYGLPTIRTLQLIICMVIAQFYALSSNLLDHEGSLAADSTLLALSRRLSTCLEQLKNSTAQQNCEEISSSNDSISQTTQGDIQRFHDSAGAVWVFNREEKRWVRPR